MSTVDEVKRKRQEKERQSRFAAPSFSDGKDHHTVDEIIGAARKQGLYPEQSVTRNASRSEKQIALDSLAKKRVYDEQQRQSSPIYRGAKKISSAAYDLAFEAAKQQAAANRIKAENTSSYIGTKNEINRLQNIKGGAARRGRDTDAYDKAIQMVKEYADEYANNTSPEDGRNLQDRQALYKDKKKRLDQLRAIRNSENYDREALKDAIGFDYNNPDDIKSVGFTDEQAKFYIQYRQHIIPHDDAENDENARRYSDMDALVQHRIGQYLDSQAEPIEKELSDYKKHYANDFYRDLMEDPNFDKIAQESRAKSEYQNIRDMDKLTQAKLYDDMHSKEDGRLSSLYNDNYDDYSAIAGAADEISKKYLDHMVADEQDIYYYLLATQGKEAAYKYLDDIAPMIKESTQAEKTAELEDRAKAASENLNKAMLGLPVSGAATIPLRMVGGVVGSVDNYSKLLQGKDIEPNSQAHYLSHIGRAAAESDAEYIDKATGGWNIGGLTAGEMYQAALSGVESVAEGVIFGPEAAALLMSTGAAEQKAEELYERGATNGQILSGSLAAGAFEYITEKVSLDLIVNKIISKQLTKKTLPRFLISALESSGVEGSEEIASSVANYFSDILIMREKSERQQLVKQYINDGYSKSEAEEKATKDFLRSLNKDFAGGFIGGFVGGGGVSVVAGTKAGVSNIAHRINNARFNKAEQRFSEQYIAENAPKIAENKGAESVLSAAQSIINDDSSDKTKALSEAVQAVSNLDENTEEYDRGIARVLQEAQKYQIERMRTVSHDTYKSSIKSRISEVAETGSALAENADTVADIVDKKTSTGGYMEFMTSLNDQERSLYEANRQSIDAVAEYMQSKEGQAKSALDFENAYTQRREDYIKTAVGAGVNQESDFREELDTFDTSDDGKNYIKGEESPVEIERVTSISPESMVFELKDGRIVDGDDIDFGDIGLATVMKAVQTILAEHGGKMAASFANAVYQAYQSGSYSNNISAFVHDVQNIYNSASSNMSYTPALLTGAVANTLRDAAVQNKQQNIQAKSKAIAGRRTNTRRQGVVVYEDDIDSKSLKGRRKVAVEVVEYLAKLTGITFRFYESKKNNGQWQSVYLRDKHGMKGQSPNGFYKNGEIYLDINAGNNGEGLILFTVSHELVHFMRDFSPESFDTYAKFLFDNYASERLTLRQAIYSEMGHAEKLKYDGAYEEVVARLSESFLRDVHLTEKSKELYDIDKTAWETVRDSLKDITSRIKRWFGKLSPDSTLGKIGEQMAAKNQEILDRFVAGVRAASENAAYTENTTGEGGVRFMARENTTISEDDLPEYMKTGERLHVRNAKQSIIDSGDSPFLYSKQDIRDFIKLSLEGKEPDTIKAYGRVGRNFADDVLLIDDNGVDLAGYYLELDGNRFIHFKDHIEQDSDSRNIPLTKEEMLSLTDYINDYTEILDCVHKKDGSVRLHIACESEDGVFVIVELISKGRKSLQPVTAWKNTKEAFHLIWDQKKKAPTTSRAAHKSASSGYISASNPIINDSIENDNPSTQKNQSRDGDYLSAVKRGDMETAQRMVDEAAERAFANSKIRGEDGKLIKVYHGTDADFTVFDRTMGRSNMDIQGLFFSPWDIDAGGYGQNVRAFYLNITNPADESTGYKALNAHKSENYAGIKAREDLEKAGYDGVNNSDEEYIAFTSEQIKSADPVTYDDNGEVIPLSERFNTENKDIRFDSRDDWMDLIGEDEDLLFSEYDDISDMVAHQYTTHSEAIGEVLRNTADIDIAAGKVRNIVSRLFNARYSNIDAQTKKTLAIRLQAELENVKTTEPQEIVNRMIEAVRGVLDDAKEIDNHTVELYDQLKAAFSGKYYLTDDQLMDLQENGETLNSFKKAMMGKMTIVNKDTAKRSVSGAIQGAHELTLEGIFDLVDAEEIFGISREQWDEYGYHAPVMLMDAFEKLQNAREVPLRERASSDDMDYIATQIAAEFTGAVVQEKYNSRKNPYVSDLVEKFEARKKEAIKRRNAYYAEKMKEIREQRDKKIAEQIEKAREARKNATVQRKRAELKERIRRMHKSLSDMSLNPKANKYIPQDLMKQSTDVLAAINLDSGFKGDRADRFRAKLDQLSKTLLKRASKYEDEAAYDTAVADMLDDLNETIGRTPLGLMSLSQLKRVHDTLKAVQTNIKNRVEVIGSEKNRYIGDIAFKMIYELDDAKIRKILGSKYMMKQLSAERFFNLICGGAKNNAGLEVYRMLDDGQLKRIDLETRFARLFEALVNDKRSKSLREDMVDIGLVDEQGNKVEITRGMMLSLYMHLMNKDNIRHVMGNGLTIPFITEYYKGNSGKAWGGRIAHVKDSTSTARDIMKQIKSVREGITDDMSLEERQEAWDRVHDLEDAFELEVDRGIREYINPMRSAIESQLNEYDKEWIKTSQQFFDVESKNELNKVTYELYGFEKAVVKNYFPIHSDTAFTDQKFESISYDMSLENIGMMKNRMQSSNAIFLEDITDVIDKQISNVAQYCGMVIPMANAKNILNVKTDSISVADSLRKYDGKAKKYLDKLLGDFVGANKEEDSGFSHILAMARHGLAGASLTMNLKVAIKQAASYPTAAAELGYIPLMKALVKGGKNNRMLSRADKELIYKYSPLLEYRTKGYSTQELGDLKKSKGWVDKFVNSPKMKWAFGWIQGIDAATVGRLWYASQYYVDKASPELKQGSDEYYKEVARVFNNVVERTQPNYTVMQRPEILRSNNSMTKMFTMFMTQRLQNMNIVFDAYITYDKMRSDLKNHKNGVTEQDKNQAKKKLVRAVSSQLFSAAVLVGMTLLADVIMHKMNPWRDDDEDLTKGSMLKRWFTYLGDSLAGSILGGSELYNLTMATLGNGTWYGLSANGFDSVDDLLTNITKAIKEKDGKYLSKAVKSLTQIAGIPYQNAMNILVGLKRHVEDIRDGRFFSFESGVNRTTKQNVHRSWSAFTLGKYYDSSAIMESLKENMINDQKAKGKNDDEAKRQAYSDIRTAIRNQFKLDYLRAKENYYHGSKDESDYKKFVSIANFMTAAKVYEKPDVKTTLEKWWNDASEKAEKAGLSMSDFLKEDAFNVFGFISDTADEFAGELFK